MIPNKLQIHDPGETAGMTGDQRRALPAICHRPMADTTTRPHSWLCEVCWGDGCSTAWPCESAIKGALELAVELGLAVIT